MVEVKKKKKVTAGSVQEAKTKLGAEKVVSLGSGQFTSSEAFIKESLGGRPAPDIGKRGVGGGEFFEPSTGKTITREEFIKRGQPRTFFINQEGPFTKEEYEKKRRTPAFVYSTLTTPETKRKFLEGYKAQGLEVPLEIQKQVETEEAKEGLIARGMEGEEVGQEIEGEERPGLLQRVSDYIAKFGIESAIERNILPAPFGVFEKEWEKGISAEEVIETPTGKALGLTSAGIEIGAAIVGGKGLFSLGKIGTGKTAGNVLKGDLKSSAIKLIEKDRQITKLSRQFKISRSAATDFYNKFQTTTVEKIIGDFSFAKTLKWTSGIAITGTLGGTFIGAWLASDNVLSNSGFTMIKLRDAVESGEMPKEDALEEADVIQEYINLARSVVNISTIINPFLWPARKAYMSNAGMAQTNYDLERKRIAEFNPIRQKAGSY